jgi:hypothetical protein
MTILVTSLLLFCMVEDNPKPVRDLPDYEALLNEKLGKGITPEKNANVLLWKALGPTPEGGTQGMPARYFKLLGIEEPPNDGEYFQRLSANLKGFAKLDPIDNSTLYDQLTWAGRRPWSAKDYPHIATWLKLNEKPLAIVFEASKRTEYFNPLVTRRTEKERKSLVGCLLPNVHQCRELTAALTARAMLKVGEGKEADAWQDLLTAHRLARLTARGATLIEGIIAISLETIVSIADVAYLDSIKLTSKQLLDRLKDLQNLPIPANCRHV